MELTRQKLRARNAVEGPQRRRAAVERAKLQWRYTYACSVYKTSVVVYV